MTSHHAILAEGAFELSTPEHEAEEAIVHHLSNRYEVQNLDKSPLAEASI